MKYLFSSINLVLILILYGLVIYLLVRVYQIGNNVDTAVAEIKTKIGSVIRDINSINMHDYNVDMEQSADISALRRKVM